MIALTLAEIAAATGGRVIPGRDGSTAETVVDGDSQTDSREIRPGQVFFARRERRPTGTCTCRRRSSGERLC